MWKSEWQKQSPLTCTFLYNKCMLDPLHLKVNFPLSIKSLCERVCGKISLIPFLLDFDFMGTVYIGIDQHFCKYAQRLFPSAVSGKMYG